MNTVRCYKLGITEFLQDVEKDLNKCGGNPVVEDLEQWVGPTAVRDEMPIAGSSASGAQGRDCSAILGVIMSLSMIVPVGATSEIEEEKSVLDYLMLIMTAFAVIGLQRVAMVIKSWLGMSAVSPALPKSTRTVGTQSMTTYTSLKKHAVAKFSLLPEYEQGVFYEGGLRAVG